MVKNQPIGLVLSGGGAKGAYQAGVWKAMVETGPANRVKVISSTSVGAINAAAFSTIRDPEKSLMAMTAGLFTNLDGTDVAIRRRMV